MRNFFSGNTQKNISYILLLLVLLAPLYLFMLYSIPWQINTDEVTIMMVSDRLLNDPTTSLLGLSYYFGFPSLIFVVFGWIATLLGGIDLYHFRLVHGLFGMGSVVLAFVLFRQFTDSIKAVTFALVLGTNHALFAISRMAMRDNTGLFLELLALNCLVYGFLHKKNLAAVLGGGVTGLAFYTYFPARITLVIWLLTLAVVLILYPAKKTLAYIGKQAGLFLLAFIVVAAPVLLATVRQSEQAFDYQKQQFLLYPQGQQLEQQWTGASTPAEAWKINIQQGLLTFNRALSDQGYIYPNYGHGFVDGLTGTLLWFGIGLSLVRVVRRKETLADIVALVGFFVLYLSFAFFITKAPNYTRLLVILPFVAYFATSALWFVAEKLRLLIPHTVPALRKLASGAVIAAGVSCIALLNISYFKGFTETASVEGNDVGSTARFVEARKNIANQTWVLAASKTYMYYSWGEAWQWRDWLGFFSSSDQKVAVVNPDRLAGTALPHPSTVFISAAAWNRFSREFTERYPNYNVHPLTPDGRLLAIEILPGLQ